MRFYLHNFARFHHDIMSLYIYINMDRHYLKCFFKCHTGNTSDRSFKMWMKAHAPKRGSFIGRRRGSAFECPEEITSVCTLDDVCRTFFHDVIGVPEMGRDKSTINTCDAISMRLSQDMRFCVTGMRNRGTYGIVLSALTLNRERVIVKLCNLSADSGVSLRGEDWLPTQRLDFEHEVYMNAALNMSAPNLVPKLYESSVTESGPAARFGMIIMEDAGPVNLHAYLSSSSVEECARIVKRCATALRNLHSLHFCHGDCHSGNLIVGDVIKFIDFSKSMYRGSMRAMFFDVVTLVNSIDDVSDRRSPELCLAFLSEYYGRARLPLESLDSHMKTAEELGELRREFRLEMKTWRKG
jgi:tRNA A-37 threonylcarbamoyl transferase component Bud32